MNLFSFKSGGIMVYHNPVVNMPRRESKNALPLNPNKYCEDLNKNITTETVEDLANVLKDNMRLSTMSSKAKSYISRKSSRASPYRLPTRCSGCCDKITCVDCEHRYRRNVNRLDTNDDPYELLQKLLKNGNLVNEAVRRLNLSFDLPAKSKQFYESDEENSCSPKRYNVSYENYE